MKVKELICEICGMGPADNVDLFRFNEKGVDGRWRCKDDWNYKLPKDSISSASGRLCWPQ